MLAIDEMNKVSSVSLESKTKKKQKPGLIRDRAQNLKVEVPKINPAYARL